MYAEKSHRLDSGWLLLGFRVFFAKVNQNLLLGHVYFHLLTAVPTNFRNSWTGKRSANEEIGHFDPLKSTWRMYSETSQLPHEQIVQRKYDRICKYYNGQMKKYLFGSALRHFVLASNLELQMFFGVYGFWAFLLQASYKCFWSVLCVDVCCPFFRDRILIRFCVESVFCLHFFASNMDSGRVSGVRFFFGQKCVMLVLCFWPAAKFHRCPVMVSFLGIWIPDGCFGVRDFFLEKWTHCFWRVLSLTMCVWFPFFAGLAHLRSVECRWISTKCCQNFVLEPVMHFFSGF